MEHTNIRRERCKEGKGLNESSSSLSAVGCCRLKPKRTHVMLKLLSVFSVSALLTSLMGLCKVKCFLLPNGILLR